MPENQSQAERILTERVVQLSLWVKALAEMKAEAAGKIMGREVSDGNLMDTSRWAHQLINAHDLHLIYLEERRDLLREISELASVKEPCGHANAAGACCHPSVSQPMPCHQQNCPWEERQNDAKWWGGRPGQHRI